MGRRARTNCSPIDSAMEKYHNDIGSRLSGVFVPPQPCLENGVNTTDALNTFTLDMRTKNNLHQDNLSGEINQFQSLNTNSGCDRDYSPSQYTSSSEKSQTLSTSLTQPPSLAMSVSSKNPELQSSGEDKEKKGLVDKLTRALFQRKHTCTRCQRKSRSCLPNKNFNSSEKHYTCGRCRESSHAMKNLVSGQNNNSGLTNGLSLTNAPTGDVILPKPRIHLKDSGYETVTSCSTVASSHSNSTINGSTKPQFPSSRLEDLSQRENKGTPCQDYAPYQQTSTHGFPVQTSYNNPTGLEQYMGVTREESPVRILKQVKTRYVENYDGYLPNTQNSQACVVKPPTLPASNAPTIEGADATCDTIDSTFSSSDQKHVHTRCRSNKKNVKVCYTCGTTSKPCFRLPWEGGWLCEDCLDGVF